MDPHFFRVEHDLLRSETFKELSGTSVKVYLVIGLHSDFGTGWAFPSIRTIAKQAGVSRQTVLDSITELMNSGLLALKKTRGRSTCYKILRNAPEQPTRKSKTSRVHLLNEEEQKSGPETPIQAPSPPPISPQEQPTGPISLGSAELGGPISLETPQSSGPISLETVAQFFGQTGPVTGPKQELITKPNTPSAAIPGTPMRITIDGVLVVQEKDLLEMLKAEGIVPKMAESLIKRYSSINVAKILLNAIYLKSQGKLQNAPGYIRTGLESEYELLPQVIGRLEARRRDLEADFQRKQQSERQQQETSTQVSQETIIAQFLEKMDPDELNRWLQRAMVELPTPFVQRNPTLSNPFIRSKIYELASGNPVL